jgi:hypothetical protein
MSNDHLASSRGLLNSWTADHLGKSPQRTQRVRSRWYRAAKAQQAGRITAAEDSWSTRANSAGRRSK